MARVGVATGIRAKRTGSTAPDLNATAVSSRLLKRRHHHSYRHGINLAGRTLSGHWRHQGSSEPTDPGRSRDDNGGPWRRVVVVVSSGWGRRNVSTGLAAFASVPAPQRGSSEATRTASKMGGGVGLKHATLRRIGGRRAGLLDRPLP